MRTIYVKMSSHFCVFYGLWNLITFFSIHLGDLSFMAVASVEIKYSRVLCFLCATFCYVFFVCFLFCMCLFESITGKVFPGKSAHVDSCDRYGVQILSKFVFIYLILSGKNSFQKSNYFLSYTKKTSTGVCSPHASLKRIIKKNTGRINEIIDLLIALF